MTVHHVLDPDLGASGATLALGGALTALGTQVEFYGFDTAFGASPHYGPAHGLLFPWKLAAFLRKHGREFDAIDASTGDTWAWLSFGRTGGKGRQAVITRSHGLEHLADRDLRARAERGEAKLSWKYPLYNGGLRLWEVERSIALADHLIVASNDDLLFAQQHFKIPPSRVSVVPHGIAAAIAESELSPSSERSSLNVAFIGSWIERKGIDTLIAASTTLVATKLVAAFYLLGTGVAEDRVRAAFPPEVRAAVHVVPRFINADLPKLTRDCDVLLQLSSSEGFSLALIEGMACGLVPVTTPVGVATTAIVDGENGLIVPVRDAPALVVALQRLASDPPSRDRMRTNAKATSRQYTWREAALKTVAVYEQAIS